MIIMDTERKEHSHNNNNANTTSEGMLELYLDYLS